MEKSIDKINPSYYNDGNVSCIEAMESAFGTDIVMHFCICNAFKYLFRHLNKNGMEDIDKALWYLNKYKELYKYGISENSDNLQEG